MAAYTALCDACMHFPVEVLSTFDIEPQHPDEFVVCQLDLNEQIVIGSFKKQRRSLKRPAMSVDQFLDCLARSEMLQTVERLREWKELI